MFMYLPNLERSGPIKHVYYIFLNLLFYLFLFYNAYFLIFLFLSFIS